MRESDNEILARAYETLEQANRTLAQQQRDPVVDVEPVANWRGCSSTQAMTTSQFNQWCRDGKPGLKASTPVIQNSTVTKSKVDAIVRAAIAEERANAQASLETLAVIIGEECGRNEKALRAEIDTLRAEINEIKVRKADLDRRGGDVLDLPYWRSYAAH